MGHPTSGINETTHALYDACVGFMVSEKTGTDSWEKVAKYVADAVAKGATLDQLKDSFKIVEQQLKADFKVKQLPGAWRSAKSTALKAMERGTSLLTPSGEAFPKSALEANMKLPSAPPDPLSRALTNLGNALHHLSLVRSIHGHERTAVDMLLVGLRTQLEATPDA